jgi:hypothetical protein
MMFTMKKYISILSVCVATAYYADAQTHGDTARFEIETQQPVYLPEPQALPLLLAPPMNMRLALPTAQSVEPSINPRAVSIPAYRAELSPYPASTMGIVSNRILHNADMSHMDVFLHILGNVIFTGFVVRQVTGGGQISDRQMKVIPTPVETPKMPKQITP